jgi:hypothetical protein
MNKINKHLVNIFLIIGIIVLIALSKDGWGWLLFLLILNL